MIARRKEGQLLLIWLMAIVGRVVILAALSIPLIFIILLVAFSR